MGRTFKKIPIEEKNRLKKQEKQKRQLKNYDTTGKRREASGTE